MLDQAETLRRMVSGEKNNKFQSDNNVTKKAKIITVTSGKGGVGKSNLVVNLGISLKKAGKKVLIFDADIGMGNDDVLMGIFPKLSIFDVLDGVAIEDIITEGPEGICLLSGGSGLNRVEDLNSDERNLLLSKLKSLDNFDYILMDTGAGINRSVLAFISSSEELVIVTTPEPTALTDAYSLLKAADHFELKNSAWIVVNKAFDFDEAQKTFNKFDTVVKRFLNMDVSYLGCVLDDKKLVQSVRKQVPVVMNYPYSEASRCINEISNKLLGVENDSQENIGIKGLFSRIFDIFN